MIVKGLIFAGGVVVGLYAAKLYVEYTAKETGHDLLRKVTKESPEAQKYFDRGVQLWDRLVSTAVNE